MDIGFPRELDPFREQVRRFVREKVPERLKQQTRAESFYPAGDDQRLFTGLLYAEGGWSCPNWPKELGGPGWSHQQQYLFERELALENAPRLNQIGYSMLGPAIIKFGTEQQRAHLLPAILKGETFWCQGYSEPNAGSDLVSLSCKARRDGENYIINGSKIWTTDATWAEGMFGLFRTDSSGKKQHGITVLLIDMELPGIELRPIKTIDGLSDFSEVSFVDVRVSVSSRLGKEHDGWTVAKHILGDERFGNAEISRSIASLGRLKRLAAEMEVNGNSLMENDSFADRVYQVEIELQALELTELRFLFGGHATSEFGAEGSMLKVIGTELKQRIAKLMFEALGQYAHPFYPEQIDLSTGRDNVGPPAADFIPRHYFGSRAASIYSGTNEIQRNILAKHVLGL